METPTTPPTEESKNVDTIFSDDTPAMENETPTEEEEEEEPVDEQVLWKQMEELDKELILVNRKLDLLSKHHNSLKGIVKSHTTKIDTVEKTVRQNKADADTEFQSIHTKHNQLEHSTDTRVATVETQVVEQNKRLDEELAFINKRYDDVSERVDDNQINITHIQDGTTVLPDHRGPASDEFKDAFKDAIVEAVTKPHASVDLLVSFPCIDSTLLQLLHDYQDIATADLIRGDLQHRLIYFLASVSHHQFGSLSVVTSELANMVPQRMLRAIYRAVLTIFERWPEQPAALEASPDTDIAHCSFMHISMDRSAEKEDDASLLITSRNSPQARVRPATKLTKEKTTKSPTLQTVKVISSKRSFVPRVSRSGWLPLPSLQSEAFSDQLFRLWYLQRAFPLSIPHLEMLLEANPGIAGLPTGATRMTPWLPLDPRRLKHSRMLPRPHDIQSYSGHEFQPPGANWSGCKTYRSQVDSRITTLSVCAIMWCNHRLPG